MAIHNNPAVKKFVMIEREDVDTDLTSGDFTFQNLDLQAEGIEEAAPVKFVCGFIEKVRVKIPFGALKSQEVLIEVSGIYLVIKPAPPNSFEKKQPQPKKPKKEKKKKKKADPKKEASSKKKGLMGGIVESLKSRVMEEVLGCGLSVANKFRIKVENIHIRLESGKADGNGVAAGFTLQKFEINPSSEGGTYIIL